MRRALAALVAFGLLLLAAAPAQAEFDLTELAVTPSEADGSVSTIAGSHPFELTTTLGVTTELSAKGEVPQGEAKSLEVNLMKGLVGSQTAVPVCSAAEFNLRSEGRPACPDSTAVGIAAVKAEFKVLPPSSNLFLHVPVYNLAPSPGNAAKLGFVALNVPIVIDVGVSEEAPHNLVAHLRDIPQAILFYGSKLTIWGNPASSAHDALRGDCVGEPVELTPQPVSLGTCAAKVPEKPFLTLPRACEGPLASIFKVDSWATPGAFTEPQSAITDEMTNCDSLTFAPTAEAQPTTSSGESPSGLRVGLDVQDAGLTAPTGRAKSDIRKVELTLPDGVTVNPSAAEGLGVCTPAQLAATKLGSQGCPDASKLGSVSVKTPLLEEQLEGSIFLAEQDDPSTSQPGAENPFDSLIAFYITIESARNGILIKQAGKVEPDPRSGRLVSTVDDIPQLPFSHFDLRFREGPRAPLTTPPLCGTYAAKAVLTPRSGGEAVESTSTFTVSSGPNGGPCSPGGVPPFRPGFEAGSINNNAGSYSPFYMRLTRGDGEQDITRFDAILPQGVTGKLAGIARCPDAAIALAAGKRGRAELASPSCPASSEVGRVLVGAGVGPALTYVPGKIYLAGPFGGDPLSIVVITPAVAGPFDVGTVVTREALTLNRVSGEVEVDGAASDPIPHILQGIPLKLRDLRVYVDRPNFTLNPTSCAEKTVKATLFGGFADVFSPLDDRPAPLGTRYQAASCSRLQFKPRLDLKLTGGTKRSQLPSLRATLRPRPGDANPSGLSVTFPHSAFLEQAHIRTICTRVQYAANLCPAGSVYGKARAYSPLLDEPLEGPMYLRSSSHKLPDLVLALHGLVDFDGVIRIDSVGDGRLRSTVDFVPDVPLSKVTIEMQGGKKGLIVNSENLCARPQRATVEATGYNGKRVTLRPKVANSCGKKKGKKGKRGKRRSALRLGT
ncbi:MAG TPA: hypothetical protein VFX45_08265 [Solirubrobacterales bacterium]|nr:hypothetical protein [Solirubrobacterales bacterium]